MAVSHETISTIETRMGDDDYKQHYQPPYDDEEELNRALELAVQVEPVSSIATIEGEKALLRAVHDDPNLSVHIVGRCDDPLENAGKGPLLRASEHSLLINSAYKELGENAHIVVRGPFQATKPRTEPKQQLADGQIVTAFMGSMVNSPEHDHRQRTPDPYRIPAVAVQASHVNRVLTSMYGHHISLAHEALHLPLEDAFTHVSEEGKKYVLTGDILWVGERTRAVGSKQVALLSDKENPVGVKLSGRTHPEDIARLRQTLNPKRDKGKLIFMLRLGPDKLDNLPPILETIRLDAPESLIMYDLHGTTEKAGDGSKTRVVGTIIDEMLAVDEMCDQFGLRLHGTHLEAMGDNSRLECIDEPGQTPTHENTVDPQLNPRQLQTVLRAFRDRRTASLSLTI